MERRNPELKKKGRMTPSGFDPRMDAEKAGQIGHLKSFYGGKKILVPGGAGFIGGRISSRLAALGAEVTIVDSLDKYCGGNLFNLHGCLGKIHLIRKRIETFIQNKSLEDFFCIFNCVGLTDHHLGLRLPDMDYQINCQSGLALLQKLSQTDYPGRVVSIGTRGQYGRGPSPMAESAPLKPLDIQSAHKTALEFYHTIYGSAFGIDFVYLRLTNTYGPGQRMKGRGIGFLGEIIRDGLEGKKAVVYGNLDRMKDLIYVDDAVDGLLCAGMIKNPRNRVYNIGGQPSLLGDLMGCIKTKIPGFRVQLQAFPEAVKKIDTGDVMLNSETFISATGWSPCTPLKEGISFMIDYYREHKRHYW